eukprot:GFUD01044492.1.p1 GENE.GFUD01044492.1~~GFUD01044492.1.p1  ORF type:complete len:726 (+),score=199.58 GFUD01044492.1:51-2228(+)
MSSRAKRRPKEKEEEEEDVQPAVPIKKKRASSKSRAVKTKPTPASDLLVPDTSQEPEPAPEPALTSRVTPPIRISHSSRVSNSSHSAVSAHSSHSVHSAHTTHSAHSTHSALLQSRVTRSRSRSILRETPPPPQRKPRIDRLDVQSEDEEENQEEENINEGPSDLISIPDRIKTQLTDLPLFSGKWMSSREGKGVIASVVLLLLLILIHMLVGSMQSESLNEKMIVLLAYALSPVRGVVETVRAAGGGQTHSPKVVKEIDYDMLANRIINSDKFKQALEKVSSEKIVNYDTQLEQKIKKEVEQISESIKDTQNMYLNLDVELTEAKTYFNTEIEKAASVLKVEVNKDYTSENNKKIGMLDTQIKELRVKLEEINLQALQDTKGSQELVSQELTDIKTKLNGFEDARLKSAIEIQKCCKTNADVNLVIENKLNAILNDDKFVLKKSLNDKYLNKHEFDQKLATLTSEIETNMETHKEKILEATRKDIETTMNEKIIELKEDFGNEILSELQSSIPTPIGPKQSADSLHSPSEVRKIVREALTKYDADKTGLFDFALESAGGSIVTTKCTEPYQLTSAVMSVWGVPFWWDTNSPRTILQPGSSPGQCWAFRGSHGVVVVQLSTPIYITAVTIEHISNLLSPDGNIYSAPSQLSLAGQEGEHLAPLLNMTYTKTGDPVQTFWLKEEYSKKRWQTVELTIHNNHGHPDYTCLYRFRVHGTVSQEQTKQH